MKKLDYTAGTILVICILLFTYNRGYNVSLTDNKPVNNLFWIDNNRIHKDSLIDCSPIYNDMLEITGSWIRVTYGDSVIHIECLDLEGSSWLEFQSSWIDAFKEGSK